MFRLHAIIEEGDGVTKFWISDGSSGSEPWIDGGREKSISRVLDLCESRGVSSLEIHSPNAMKCYTSSRDNQGRVVWSGSVRPNRSEQFNLC